MVKFKHGGRILLLVTNKYGKALACTYKPVFVGSSDKGEQRNCGFNPTHAATIFAPKQTTVSFSCNHLYHSSEPKTLGFILRKTGPAVRLCLFAVLSHKATDRSTSCPAPLGIN